MAKKPKAKFNNDFKVFNDEADRIRNLSNQELLDYVTKQHEMVRNLEESKKSDPQLKHLSEKIAERKAEVYDHPKLKDLEEQVKQLREELKSGDEPKDGNKLEDLENQKRNELQPLAEDITSNRGKFNLAMQVIKERKDRGMLQLKVN